MNCVNYQNAQCSDKNLKNKFLGFSFKRRWICCVTERLVSSQEGLWSME